MKISKKILVFLTLFLTAVMVFTACSTENSKPEYNKEDLVKNYIKRTAPVIEKAEDVTPTAGKFTVSNVFSKDMVLQRDEYIRIWGWAEEDQNGKTICAEFMGLKGSATIENGEWLITLDGTLSACKDLGNTLRVYSATHEEEFDNVLVGDVYLVLGQSNAAATVKDTLAYAADDPNYNTLFTEDDITNDDNIRVIQNLPTDKKTNNPTVELAKDLLHIRSWRRPEKIASSTSAIGYFFAKQLVERTNNEIPIGIIECSQSAAVLAAFMPAEVAEACNADVYNESTKGYTSDSAVGDQASRTIYNQRIYPFMNFTISGIIWYQGESDNKEALASAYADNFKALIEYYRNKINQNYHNFPVFIVELPTEYRQPADFTGEKWSFLDIGNTRAHMGEIPSILENSFIAVTGDLWTNKEFWNSLHPYNKWNVATRIVDMCMTLFYTEYDSSSNIEYIAGPVFAKYASKSSTKVELYFNHVGDGLKTVDGKDPMGIEVLCNGTWVTPEKITISDYYITVSHSAEFTAARHFAITDSVFNETLNVCNSNNLPLAAFYVEIK